MLTLLIVNINNLPATSFGAVFEAVGLDTMSYTPTAANVSFSGWPTLAQLIDGNKQLLTFLDNGADLTTVPYLIDGAHFSPWPVKLLF